MNIFQRSATWSILALWFIATPVVLFCALWIRSPYNICMVLSILVGCIVYSRHTLKCNSNHVIPWRYLIATLLLSIVLAVLSGAGGFVWQKPDWTKHNVILNDLVQYSWPVYYGPSAYVADTTLVYYVAYYLPAALIGKVLGWRAAELGLFFTNILGLWIVAQLVSQKMKFAWHVFGIFFLMSGLDVVGIVALEPYKYNSIQFLHLEQYALGLQFSSIFTQLAWVPQHAIVGWMGALVLYDAYRQSYLGHALPAIVPLTLLWSPFVSLGLTLVFLPFLITSKVRSILNGYSVVGIGLTGILLLFYKSQLGVLHDSLQIYLLKTNNWTSALGMMIMFLILDLFIFFIVFVVIKRHMDDLDRKLSMWIFLILMIIAQFTYGVANDFVMRVSIPALSLLFFMLISYVLRLGKTATMTRALIIFLVVCGACTPTIEVAESMRPNDFPTNERPRTNMLDAHLRYRVIHQQYMGLSTKLFGRYLGNYPIIDAQ